MPDLTPAYTLLKMSLGRTTVPPELETLLRAKCDQAAGELRRAGLSLDDGSPADNALIAAYAEWIYRRRNAEDPKPRALRDEIHSRQIARTTGGTP